MKNINTQLMAELQQELQPYPETLEFVIGYRNYVHAIDDLIDGPNRPTAEDILKVSAMASCLFSTNFWLKHSNILVVTEQLVNNTYADSVIWESSSFKQYRNAADTLRHAGLDMFFAAILITLGRDKLREYSLKFRTQCYEIQSSMEDIK